MSFLDSKDDCVALLDEHYNQIQTNRMLCVQHEGFAYTHWVAGETQDCLYDILMCLFYIDAALAYTAYKTTGHGFKADMIYFLDTFAGGEVTWQSIVEAWMVNDYEGRTWTIGVIDKMRQILWDEPFNLTFAARPEQESTA